MWRIRVYRFEKVRQPVFETRINKNSNIFLTSMAVWESQITSEWNVCWKKRLSICSVQGLPKRYSIIIISIINSPSNGKRSAEEESCLLYDRLLLILGLKVIKKDKNQLWLVELWLGFHFTFVICYETLNIEGCVSHHLDFMIKEIFTASNVRVNSRDKH